MMFNLLRFFACFSAMLFLLLLPTHDTYGYQKSYCGLKNWDYEKKFCSGSSGRPEGHDERVIVEQASSSSTCIGYYKTFAYKLSGELIGLYISNGHCMSTSQSFPVWPQESIDQHCIKHGGTGNYRWVYHNSPEWEGNTRGVLCEVRFSMSNNKKEKLKTSKFIGNISPTMHRKIISNDGINFSVTSEEYTEYDDWNKVVQNEARLGEKWEIADWERHIKEAFGNNETEALEFANFIDDVGSSWVTRNGSREWRNGRYYFVSAHFQEKPGSYLDHDDLFDNIVSLGSWYNRESRIVAVTKEGLQRGEFEIRSDFINYWNQITGENEHKWGIVESKQNEMKWGDGDKIARYARKHGIPWKFHTLIFGNQYPKWMDDLPENEQLEAIEAWMDAAAKRYPDVHMIDVVNEARTNPFPFKNALGGSEDFQWIKTAFEMARERWPHAVLIYNDYNIIEYKKQKNWLIKMINTLQEDNTLIDAIGAQSHDVYKRDMDNGVIDNINEIYKKTSLPIFISEYDIPERSDSKQKEIIKEQFPKLWEHRAIAGITLWGYVLEETWEPATGLLRQDGTPRPALKWLQDYVRDNPNPQNDYPDLLPSITVNPVSSDTKTFGDIINVDDDVSWLWLWTGNEVNENYIGSYVNTSSFNNFGYGWIEVEDLDNLKLDFAQYENTILYIQPWVDGSSRDWKKFDVDFQASDQVRNSINMDITRDTPSSEIIKVENAQNGNHWLQLWSGDYLDTSAFNSYGNGWIEASDLSELVISGDAFTGGDSLWVRQYSQSPGAIDWIDYGWLELKQ